MLRDHDTDFHMTLRICALALARNTFDVPFAEDCAAKAFANLEQAGFALIGPRSLLFDAQQAEAALAATEAEAYDLLLLMQVTFTDATMTVKIASEAKAPLAIWAFPEPRAGGRLRLNSFCGLNLAAHALGRADKPFGWLFEKPDSQAAVGRLRAITRGEAATAPVLDSPAPNAQDREIARNLVETVRGARIGLVGQHPAGFDTCRYDEAELEKLAGVEVVPMPVGHLFERAAAQAAIPGVVDHWREEAEFLEGLDTLKPEELNKSLSIAAALDEIAEDKDLDAVAVRCWPETFTDYGCAACGPMGFLTEQGLPCACEADVVGSLTTLVLNAVSDDPSWLVDIVDMDAASDTGVFWHCGSAPVSMADPESVPMAQIHSNRRMALLQEFPLKPGRITIMRISQSKNRMRMILAGGEVIRAPKSFTGTSGVVRFDRKAEEVMNAMMDERLEHHVAFAYGEHRPLLRAMAAEMGLPVVEIA